MSDISIRLRAWVDREWPHLSRNDFALKMAWHSPEENAPKWQSLPGDAGFRKYYRLASEPPLLAVYAPPEHERNEEFVQVARLLRAGGVLAPAVAACDLEQGFMLVEDLGPSLLLEHLTPDTVDDLYQRAMTCLLQIQQCRTDAQVLQPYNRTRLHDEVRLFPDWFIRQLLGYAPEADEEQLLEATFIQLEDSALEQPQVLVHRDFHSRNLIYQPEGPPGVIDFQDAVVGPITYDLVSLLRDCYARWPEENVERWAQAYYQRALQAGLIEPMPSEQFHRWFDWMGLQRHIKVLGIFARLSLRDGKHAYLKDLPRVIDYTLTVARKYPELEAFVDWFENRLMPRIDRQPWFPGPGREHP